MRYVPRRRHLAAIAGLSALLITTLAPAPAALAATSVISVDLGASTGAITHGASGNLYGLADPGIPSDNLIAPISPNTLAQKAPDGLQHPNGDALVVGPQWLRNGGNNIEIYMQDIYKNFPYEQPGLADYLAKVDTMVRKVVASPNKSSYVYVPFNEPNDIWYSGNLTQLLADWKTVYQKIRSIDPTARIAGLNYSHFVASDYQTFLQYAKANNVLPDVVTWHELGGDFFSDWYTHYNAYRASETSLGISPRPISINEYARSSGDLGVPGNLVQYMARLENSKVSGSLAYWTDSGTLNDLVAAFESNKPTGGWWLYKWYGEMTGNTVAVTPPTQTGPLQAVATYDDSKKQARVVLGGNADVNGTFDTSVAFKNVPAALGTTAHAIVYGVDASGVSPSTGPYIVSESDVPVSGGAATVALTGLKGSSGYEVVLTPNTDLSPAVTNRYEAEFAELGGTATVANYGAETGYSGTNFVWGYGSTNNASTTFVVNAPTDGWYTLGLRYAAGPYGNGGATRVTRLTLNGSQLVDLSVPSTANWSTWNTVNQKVFLTGGINRIGVNAFTNDDSDAINPDYLDVTPTTGTVTAYEAEAAANTLAGAAVVQTSSNASGGKNVGYIGNGAANTLTVNGVNAPTAGVYRMVVTYTNGEYAGSAGGAYNNNSVNRYADISVNGGTSARTFFRVTGDYNTYRTAVVDVTLAAGSNRITFANANAYAPNIDRIQIAPRLG